MWDEIAGATGAAGAVKYAAKGVAGAATRPKAPASSCRGGRRRDFGLRRCYSLRSQWPLRWHGSHADLGVAGRDVRLRVLLRAAWLQK